ncbi:amino acid permease [Ktedonobacter robiniae]|uniref:Diguanylate cyclase n=1 Tax=Ktedonobacter robiniae TaxID=2778365 RepID=A0ABQ3V2A5_9CHLR|nr:amino acid permease [Ktedonobacter robiniae]GHO59108.1 hypothetical protein KSB_75830 [Ktedonobacter robiniae]
METSPTPAQPHNSPTPERHTDQDPFLRRLDIDANVPLQATQPVHALRQLPKTLTKRDLLVFSLLTVLMFTPVSIAGGVGYGALIYWLLAFLIVLPIIIISRWLSLRVASYGGQYRWITALGGSQWGSITGLFFWLAGLFATIASLISSLVIFQIFASPLFATPVEELEGLLCLTAIVLGLIFIPLGKLKYILAGILILNMLQILLLGLAGYLWVLNGHAPATSSATILPGPQHMEFFSIAIWGLLGGEAPYIMTSEMKNQHPDRGRKVGNFIWRSYAIILPFYLFSTLGVLLFFGQQNNPIPIQTGIAAIQNTFGLAISKVVLIFFLIGTTGKTVLFITMSSRLLFMAARDGMLPEGLTRINRQGIPYISLLVQVGITAAFVLLMDLLLTGISDFNPISTQHGLPFYLFLRAITTVIWLLAAIQVFAMVIRYIVHLKNRSRHSRLEARISGREGAWIVAVSCFGIITMLISIVEIIGHSWAPTIFSQMRWNFTVVTFTLIAIVIGWLCAEIPRKHTLLTTLRKVNTREQALRNQLEEAYHEQQILVAQQQELLTAVDQLYRENARAAVTDPITSLPNHRAVIAYIDTALREASETQESIALLFVDLDRFKLINDSWGHPAGDAVLHEVGIRLQDTVGITNFVGRYGGEEFAVILRHSNVSEAVQIAEKIRHKIMEKPFIWDIDESATPVELTITASIGISIYPYHGETREALLEQADRAMYRAKHSGRNRVCIVFAEERAHQIITVSGLGSFSSEEICTARALLAAMQAYDKETYEHAQRMVNLSEAVARRLRCGSEEIHNVRLAAMFHDIGKVAVPDSILHKPGPLNTDEWEVIRRHPDTGRQILSRAGGTFAIVAYIIGAHHERWDGQGYPGGLAGEQIPLAARILSVVDAYDTMISGRIYRKPISHEEACAELKHCADTQFDSTVVEAFLQVLQLSDVTTEASEPFLPQHLVEAITE